MPETRRCWKCEATKPLTEFVKSRGGTKGYASTCRQCKRDIYNAKRYGDALKTCKRCGKQKRLTEFWLCAEQKDGRGTRCKTCCKEMETRGLQVCKRCLHAKKVDAFSKLKRWQGRRDHWCKSCRVRLVVNWNRKHPKEVSDCRRQARLNQKYGMSLAEFGRLLEEQEHCCALCGEPFDEDIPAKKARVDHCHNTGKVRALLHSNCNVLIGMAEESCGLLRAAIAYLRNHK